MVYKDGNDIKARTHMSFASMIMGYNLAYVGTCLPHRIQYAFGITSKMKHALGLLALYPSWLYMAIKEVPDKMKIVASAMGIKNENIEFNIWEKNLLQGINHFIKKLDLKVELKDFNILDNDLSKIINRISGDLDADPVYKNDFTILEILKNSL